MRDPRTYAIIGAAMEVHRELRHGLLEAVYQEALAQEFESRGIPFLREVELPIHYKGRKLGTGYRADFVCFGEVLIELKSQAAIGGAEEAQILNYLRLTGLEIALLLNFGLSSLEHHRYVLTAGDQLRRHQAESPPPPAGSP